MFLDSRVIKTIKSKVKTINNNRRVRAFYLERISKGKTHLAYILDLVFMQISFFVITLAFFFTRTHNLMFSLVITFQFFILFVLMLYKINQLKFQKSIKEVNYELVKKKMLQEYINKTKYEFNSYFVKLLEEGSLNNTIHSSEKEIDLIGDVEGEKVAIKLYQYKEDYKVSIPNVREFFLKVKELGITSGIIITTSGFSQDVYEFLPKLKEHCNIHLLDMDGVMELLQKADMYPTNKEIEKMVLNDINENRKKILKHRNNLLSGSKAIKYFALSFFLYLGGGVTPYKAYYNLASYGLLILGTMSLGKHLLYLLSSRIEKEEVV